MSRNCMLNEVSKLFVENTYHVLFSNTTMFSLNVNVKTRKKLRRKR